MADVPAPLPPRAARGTFGPMRALTVRVSDDLGGKLRAAAERDGTSESAFVREAIAEKIGRSDLARVVADLERRVAHLERQLAARR